ncbi:hypothetical protein HNO88_002224 [Novosphingobium chloroacetimidivorans]|uniref:Uncharacterized protein n=1 Tax=Novosphingobium chloroacetimidivorans TaxID=1428314 RepID=A0A7W7KB27_9SPHN|nr:DUF6683 family protein [Novosphingobium chloroacetimidivorans]MBB4858898.1 hypothetical protein [Novosphingobium chloroacetimidivorans]
MNVRNAFSAPLVLSLLPLAGVLALPASVAAQAPSPTHFSRDPALLEAKEQQLIAATRAQNPAMADALQKAFSQDIVAQIAPQLKTVGLDPDDMADMTTIYWVNAWEAANGVIGSQPDRALVQGARRQIAGVLASDARLAQMTDAQKQDVADTMLIQGLLVDARMQAVAKQPAGQRQQMSDTIAGEAQQLLKTDLRAVTLTPQGFKPKSAASATPAARNPALMPSGAAPAHAENWTKVEGVYFRSAFISGVGGMMVQDFEPLVLFRDGTYYAVDDAALEDVDLAAEHARKPGRFGKWQKAGTRFTLIDDDDKDGKSDPVALQDGQFFKAFPAEASGGKLAATYSRVSGGGNTALGGDVIVGGRTDISFAADGSFGRKGSRGGLNTGASTGVGVSVHGKNASAGRYRIKNYTITMTQADGRTERKFFAFGSHHNPPALDTDMMFIGDRVYVVMD